MLGCLKPIKTDAHYRTALKKIEGLVVAKPSIFAGDKLHSLVTLGSAYKMKHFMKHFPMGLPDPWTLSSFAWSNPDSPSKTLRGDCRRHAICDIAA